MVEEGLLERGEAEEPVGLGQVLDGAQVDRAQLPAGQLAVSLDNAQVNAEYRRIADEQAALRRVATLVASGASPTAVFDAVAAEIERLLDADAVVSPAPVEDAVSVADAVPVTLDAGTTTKLRARSTVLR